MILLTKIQMRRKTMNEPSIIDGLRMAYFSCLFWGKKQKLFEQNI